MFVCTAVVGSIGRSVDRYSRYYIVVLALQLRPAQSRRGQGRVVRRCSGRGNMGM